MRRMNSVSLQSSEGWIFIRCHLAAASASSWLFAGGCFQAGHMKPYLLARSSQMAVRLPTRFRSSLLRPIPAVAFMPLALMMFGFGVNLEASIVAYACVWPIMIVTTISVRNIEPRLLDVADVMEMTFAEKLRKIILPAAFARINVGLRVAAGIALVVAVTTEIVLNPRGLGYSLILAQQSLNVALMYAQLAWLCLVGMLLNAVLRALGGSPTPAWRPA